MQFLKLFAGVVGLVTAASAFSQSAEPDDFTSGTNISNSFPGVTLSTAGGGGIQSLACSGASTGSNVYAPVGSGCNNWYGFGSSATDPYSLASLYDSQYVFRADFSPAASSVTIDAIPDDSFDPYIVAIYDASGNLIDYYQDAPGDQSSGVAETVTLTSGSANIAFVVAAGISGDTIDLDNLSWSAGPGGPSQPQPIPTMSEWGLILMTLVLSIAGLLGMRRMTA